MPTVDNIDLDVQAFVLCDSCVRDVNTGKTSIQGIFDIVNAQAFPCLYPLMTAYFRLQFDEVPTAPMTLNLSLAMTSPSQLRNMSPGTQLAIPIGAERAEGFIGIQGMIFPEAGKYSFELLVNGQPVADFTLTLQHLGQPSGTGHVLN
jgi:hypothetical protein